MAQSKRDRVRSVYAKYCKDYIIGELKHDYHARYLTNKKFKALFLALEDAYDEHVTEDTLVCLTERCVESKEQFEKLYERYHSNDEIFIPLKNCVQDALVFNAKMSKYILLYFKQFLNEINKAFDDHDQQVDDEEIKNLMNVREYNIQHPDTPIETEYDHTYTFVADKYITIDDIQGAFNISKHSKFVCNPSMKTQQSFDIGSNNTVQALEVNIIRRVHGDQFFEKEFVTQYVWTCAHCYEDFYCYRHHTHKTLKHDCGFTKGGKPKLLTTQSSALRVLDSIPVYLYELRIDDNTDARNIVHMYSFDSDLRPGRYVVNAVHFTNPLNELDRGDTGFVLMLAHKRIKPDISNIMIQDDRAKTFCKKHNLPYVRVFDLIFTISRVIEEHTDFIVDQRGLLLQLFLTISLIAKNVFHYDKLAISVIGNKSLSKTYPASLYGMLLDRRYEYVQSGEDTTVPGLKGGINNKKLINGKMTSVFEHGKFTTAGLCVFDEGENFYRDKLMNAALKNFLDKRITIAKVGGQDGIEQNYTPVILCNFYEHHDEYRERVEKHYRSFVYQEQPEYLPHGSSERERKHYISKTNLYMPLDYYIQEELNEELAKAIALTRAIYRNNQRDWKSGGSMPASDRILFDVACWNVEKRTQHHSDVRVSPTRSVLPEQYELPYEELIETVKVYYGSVDRDINLRDTQRNDRVVNTQLKHLDKSIEDWLKSKEGYAVHAHLAESAPTIDAKLNSLVFACARTVQLCEDITSTELSENVKRFLTLFFLKCKRGVSKKEYDFVEHIDYKNLYYDLDELRAQAQVAEEDETVKRVVKEVNEKINNADHPDDTGVAAFEHADVIDIEEVQNND